MRSTAVFLGFFLFWMNGAYARQITVSGITFSDELGGFELQSVTGGGSAEDPFVIIEKVTGPKDPTLTIRGLINETGNRLTTHHAAGIAIHKIAINATGHPWQNYEMELRKVVTRHSPYEDGLSFGQNSALGTSYISSNFPYSQKTDEPQDTLSFSGANIAPGESATFNFIVTDMSPVPAIYILQRPLQPVSLLKNHRRLALWEREKHDAF